MTMYMSPKCHQISFNDFNQSCGMQLDPGNEWVVLADALDWGKLESGCGYADRFPSRTGHPAKPFRMALGALIIQKRKGLADRPLTREIAENPYLQYFLGLPSFQKECPFEASVLVSFRKRLDAEALMRANDSFLSDAAPTNEHAKDKPQECNDGENCGTAILDATCSPSNIRYPMDFSLLNEARERLEGMIDYFHKAYHPWGKPRTYRRVARKSYLALAKCRKRTAKKIRMETRRQLEHVRRDLGYLARYMGEGYAMPAWKGSRSAHTTRARCSRTRSRDTASARGTTPRVRLSTRYTGPGPTVPIARSAGYVCPGPGSGVQRPVSPDSVCRARSTGTTPTG